MTVLLSAKTRIQKNVAAEAIEFIHPVVRDVGEIQFFSFLSGVMFWACIGNIRKIFDDATMTDNEVLENIGLAVAGFLFGAVTSRVLLWRISGKEILSVTETVFHYCRKDALFSRRRDYGMDAISRIRFSPELDELEGKAPSCIKFAYGMKTISIMEGIDEEEALLIFSDIAQKFPVLPSRFERGGGV